MIREKLAIFFVSISIIGFQLSIINTLSYSQWHHFAYLAVSIAMLGFGSSGVLLSVWSDFFRNNANSILPWLFFATGISMLFSPILVNFQWFRFDTFLVFSSSSHAFKLLITCVFLFIPFLLGATSIGLLFMIRKEEISKLYAWNLVGSGIGGGMLIFFSYYFFPLHLSMIFGFVAVFSAWVLTVNRFQKLIFGFSALAGVFVMLFQNPIPFTSEFKPLSKALLMPDTKVEAHKPVPHGTLQYVKSENIRQANGLSLTFSDEVPLVDLIFLNAQPYFAIEKGLVNESFYKENLFWLQYEILNNVDNQILLLQPISSFFPSQALLFDNSHITLVEPIKSLFNFLGDLPWNGKGVSLVNEYPREFLFKDTREWDAIVFPMIGSMGNSGLGAVQEQYLYTTNAIGKSIDKLSGDGILVFSSVMDNPPRYSLKLISLISRALRDKGFSPNQSIISVRSWNTLLVLVKPSSFQSHEIEFAEDFCNRLGFDMVHPISQFERNTLSDTVFNSIFAEVLELDSSPLLNTYSFNLLPPNDNRPFFSQFIKLNNLRSYLGWYGMEGVLYLELGYLIVWASLIVCIILALLAIAAPLVLLIKRRKFIVSVWLYFAMLGLGYMLFEVSLIQQSILTLGNPIMSSALIISVLLCFSAVGSFYSSGLKKENYLLVVLLLIGISIIILGIFKEEFTMLLIGRSKSIQVIGLVMSIAPTAVFMGMAFPIGLRRLSEKEPNQIPIAWGVNGFFSVVAAPFATIVAVEAGFTQVIILSSVIYLICIPIAISLYRKL
jgi:MFS family permease